MTRLLLFLSALTVGCYAIQEPEQTPHAEAPKPTGFGAVSYFEAKCARCHGPQGAFMTTDFAKGKTDEQLTEVTKRMCDGPGGAPLEEKDLKVEVAYMRAMGEGRPFLVWTEEKEARKGESSVEKVRVVKGGESKDLEMKEGIWTLPLGDEAVLEAGDEEKQVRLDFRASNVSQSVVRN